MSRTETWVFVSFWLNGEIHSRPLAMSLALSRERAAKWAAENFDDGLSSEEILRNAQRWLNTEDEDEEGHRTHSSDLRVVAVHILKIQDGLSRLRKVRP